MSKLGDVIDWIFNNPPKPKEDLNTRLVREADEAERRAATLEEEAKIRARLLLAKTRIKKAKQQMSARQLRVFKLVLIVVVVGGMLFLMLKDCGGA